MRFLGSCILLVTVVLGAGCASPNPADLDRPRESSIPWNKPQSWEGPGVMGSSMQGSR